MKERPTFQKVMDSAKSHAREALGGLVLLTAAAIACKSGQGQEIKTTPTQPANSPVATETIAPTPTSKPTEVPTVAPTEVPVEVPATIEQVRFALFDKDFGAYPKLDPVIEVNLPRNQTREYIEELLAYCNGELIIQDIPRDHPNYNQALINACISVPQEIVGIPGHEDILEFSDAIEKLGSFTINKVDKLYKSGGLLKEENGQVVPISENEFVQYRSEVASFFPK